jgi:hypothetical protein
MKAGFDVVVGQVIGCFEVGEEMITFQINVARNVVSDLAGGVAQTDPLVVRGRANPQRLALVADRLRFPEADMIALPWVVADGLLEG